MLNPLYFDMLLRIILYKGLKPKRHTLLRKIVVGVLKTQL